jgi:hypothetical protein
LSLKQLLLLKLVLHQKPSLSPKQRPLPKPVLHRPRLPLKQLLLLKLVLHRKPSLSLKLLPLLQSSLWPKLRLPRSLPFRRPRS